VPSTVVAEVFLDQAQSHLAFFFDERLLFLLKNILRSSDSVFF
jgi:hypothetical protein